MRNIFSDEDNQKELLEKGYTIVPLLSSDEVDYILKELKELRPAFDFIPTGAIGEDYHDSLSDSDIEYRRRTSDLIGDVFGPHIVKLFCDYKVIQSGFFIKPPGKGDLSPHQHPPISTSLKDMPVIVWCPLVDVDEFNGNLQVVEGSHKIVAGVSGNGSQPFFINYNDIIKKHSKPIPLKAGECVIFDNYLIHWSGVNKSKIPRISAASLCLPKEAKPAFYYNNMNTPDKRIEVFEIDRDFFIENNIVEMMSKRPENVKSLGFLKNKNRDISDKEFVKLLKSGKDLRPIVRLIEGDVSLNKRLDFIKRLRNYFKF